MGVRHLLVIDDDPDVRALARRVLEWRGDRVTTRPTPDLTPSQVAALAPDLIVLDFWFDRAPRALPFLDALRADPRTQPIPVVLVSAAVPAVEHAHARLVSLGCHVLAKPFDVRQFLAAIEQGLTAAAAAPWPPGGSSGDAALGSDA